MANSWTPGVADGACGDEERRRARRSRPRCADRRRRRPRGTRSAA
ncbi:hypothetical protein ACU686_17910 [Yinghuangia aomiensis]